MNRQFNQHSYIENNSMTRNLSVYGNKQETMRYMERPSSMNVSQMDYNNNQTAGARKPVYNPNPFGNDTGAGSPFSSDMSSVQSNMIQQQQQPRREIAVLFYSNNCSHSKTFLAALYKTPLNDVVKKICIDHGDIKIPKIITEVPTLVARGIQRPLVGDQVSSWLQNETKKLSGGGGGGNGGELQCYSFSGKDNYSVIGEVNDDMSVCNSFADWDKDYYINAPKESDKGDKKKVSQTGTQISEMNQINRMRNERDSLFVDQRHKMKAAQIDPEKFNEMFLKQQRQNIKSI